MTTSTDVGLGSSSPSRSVTTVIVTSVTGPKSAGGGTSIGSLGSMTFTVLVCTNRNWVISVKCIQLRKSSNRCNKCKCCFSVTLTTSFGSPLSFVNVTVTVTSSPG